MIFSNAITLLNIALLLIGVLNVAEGMWFNFFPYFYASRLATGSWYASSILTYRNPLLCYQLVFCPPLIYVESRAFQLQVDLHE